MNLFLMLAGAVILGYLLPVLTSLVFCLVMSRVAPEKMASNGRILPRFVVAYGLAWTVGAVGAGFVIMRMMTQFRYVGCAVTAAILIAVLWSNADEMKKRQSTARLMSMSAATVIGIALGAAIALRAF